MEEVHGHKLQSLEFSKMCVVRCQISHLICQLNYNVTEQTFNFIPETKVWPSCLASAVRVYKMPGGGLRYEMDGDARRLT